MAGSHDCYQPVRDVIVLVELLWAVQRLGARDSRLSTLAAVKQSDDVTAQEQLARLEEDIRQQDVILAGYEKDNEQLRNEMKQLRSTNKANEERMFHENHKLRTQLANLQLVNSFHFTHACTYHLSFNGRLPVNLA